jgi:hypothetical protein
MAREAKPALTKIKPVSPYQRQEREYLMKRLIILGFLTGSLAGCVEPPASPMEAAARRAAAAELTAKQCAGFAGGYESVRKLRHDANQNIATARRLGATDATIAKARADVRMAFDMQVAFSTPQQACNVMVGELAWATG